MSEIMIEAKPLTYELLKSAIAGNAAAIRCRSVLQPAAGKGTKVFPPTHSGGVYASEKRRVAEQADPVECVLLDSVQSQANRMEEALQDAVDRGLFDPVGLPVIEVHFGDSVADVQRVTSLQAPHRAADAILRDSLLDGKPFRDSEPGKRITDSSLINATALFEFCPTALVFGVWDSTGPKGGMGAKFARAIVSEIVGVGAVTGTRTSSRIDPLQIRAGVKVVKDKTGGWSIAKDDKVKGAVSPSEINHGNIPPDVADGGVTVASAEHTAVLSLPQLRRLRFPIEGKLDPKIDDAARTVLASLALVGLTLASEKGFDLRSRCLLFPDTLATFEILEIPGKPTGVRITSKDAIAIFKQAVEAATKLGLPWRRKLDLVPSPQLIELVKRSQALAATSNSGEEA